MGKPTGFIEVSRQLPADREPLTRVKDWGEFHLRLSEDALKNQGSRCMDCGVPFCHTGIMIEGMVSGCPLHNLMPEWNDLVCRGLWKAAWIRLRKTNNFPEFTGRVCPSPCEGACTAGLATEPVTIKCLERAISDKAEASGWRKPNPPQGRTGRKVAVVGSGPAGLAAADQLNQAGHQVTVFERSNRPGGLLTYGIPNMKLDKGVVQDRIDLMDAEGIEFQVNCEVGKDYAAGKLKSEFDAIVLCGGATKARDLMVENRQLKGIHFAVDFLTQATLALLDEDQPEISAAGKQVVVIGGGDTGTDCVGTSIRQGCECVVQLEILPKPPVERLPDNPWPQFPRVLKTDYGQEEAVALYGRDPRRYSVTAKAFEGDAQGQIKAVHTIGVDWVMEDQGRRVPREIPGSEKVWPADLVLLAMGFVGPEDQLLRQLGVEQDHRGNVRTASGAYVTNVPGIFCAGDMRRGQSLVVWAISEGRQVAAEVDRYLMGSTNL